MLVTAIIENIFNEKSLSITKGIDELSTNVLVRYKIRTQIRKEIKNKTNAKYFLNLDLDMKTIRFVI